MVVVGGAVYFLLAWSSVISPHGFDWRQPLITHAGLAFVAFGIWGFSYVAEHKNEMR